MSRKSEPTRFSQKWYEDIPKLSTEDLVLSWTILHRSYVRAIERRDPYMAAEFSARLRACDTELGLRQLTIDDELALLRERNRIDAS